MVFEIEEPVSQDTLQPAVNYEHCHAVAIENGSETNHDNNFYMNLNKTDTKTMKLGHY